MGRSSSEKIIETHRLDGRVVNVKVYLHYAIVKTIESDIA